MTRLFFVLLIVWMPALAEAKLDLPTGMTAADRRRALEILGYGSGTKILGDPYPLGGYSGVEVGLSNEVIPTTEISNLGNKSNLQGETSYLQMSFAKGLYYNFDVLVNFAPMGQGEEVSSFGGGVRWGFFEAEYLPIALMVQVAANSTSFQNKINVSTQTLDLIASFSVEKVTLYGGVGTIRASGIFLGGVEGVTDTGSVENETLSTGRLLAGAAVKFSKFFAAIEVDRTSEPNYSGKLGIRF